LSLIDDNEEEIFELKKLAINSDSIIDEVDTIASTTSSTYFDETEEYANIAYGRKTSILEILHKNSISLDY
jgi:hypothetical protein